MTVDGRCDKNAIPRQCGPHVGRHSARRAGSGSCPRLLEADQNQRSPNVPCSERRKEIKRRRHRRKKLGQFSRQLKKATVSERAAICEKIRNLSPGGVVIVENWGLKER